MEPKIDWRAILRRFMTEKAQTIFRWIRGNRRFVAQGSIFHLHRVFPKAPGEIAVAIDTSGSIGQKELDAFGSEVQGIIKDARRATRIYVIYCDAGNQSRGRLFRTTK